MPNETGKQAITVAELMATLSAMPLDSKVFMASDGPPPFKSSMRPKLVRHSWGVVPLLVGFVAETAPMAWDANHIFPIEGRPQDPDPVVVLYRRGDVIPE